MKKFVKNLRSKPEIVRKQILYTSTTVLGFLLILFWFSTLRTRLSAVAAPDIGKDLKPLGLIKENLTEVYSGVSSGIKSLSGSNQNN